MKQSRYNCVGSHPQQIPDQQLGALLALAQMTSVRNPLRAGRTLDEVIESMDYSNGSGDRWAWDYISPPRPKARTIPGSP